MAKKALELVAPASPDITYNIDLTLTADQVRAICDRTEAIGLTTGQKVAGYALTCLKEISRGGILLDAMEIQHIQEATGVEVSSSADILPILSDATHMEEGFHVVELKIDPTYWDALQETADMRGWSVQQLAQEAIDNAEVKGWFEAIPEGSVSYVLMEPRAKQAIEESLGGRFETGTRLLELIRQALSRDTDVSLFEDLGEEPGRGAA